MKRTLLVLLLLLAGCDEKPLSESAPPNASPLASGETRLVVLLTDQGYEPLPAKKMYLSISKIYLHEKERGWVMLTENARRYDLVPLRNRNSYLLLMNTSVEQGRYDQAKLYFNRASITEKGGEQPLYLPGSELPLKTDLTLKKGNTYSIVLNLDALKSLYDTLDNHHVFAPQLQLEIRENPTLNEAYEVSGGAVLQKIEIGMDERGIVEERGRIDPEVKLRILNNKVHATRPILSDFNAGANVYLQSSIPLKLALKEIRIKGQLNRYLSLYEGEQHIALGGETVQKIASTTLPADTYTQASLYFTDGLDTLQVTAKFHEEVKDDETLNVLIRLPEKLPEVLGAYSSVQKGVYADYNEVGQRTPLLDASLDTIQEAEHSGRFQP